MTHEEKIDAFIAEFNIKHADTDRWARRPVFATSCDYEIVSRSGVMGQDLTETESQGEKSA